MNSFYGDVKNGTRVSLIFDKTYSNRKAMEAAISKLGGTVGNKNGDGIYNTRYVLIDYGEKRYCPYMSIKTVNATWYDPTTLLFNDKGPQLYIYNEQTTSYSSVKSTDKYNKSTVYYVRMDGETAALDKSKVALTPDYIDENCEYYKNRKIDENEYNGAYHHTVWQKIWCSVGVNSTVTEKYVMVAELDAKAPQFNVIIDAPDDNDVYSLVSKRTSVGKRLPLDTNNLYYKKVNNEFIPASDEDVTNWNDESIDYNNLTVKELFSSPLFRYSEISSDVYYYKPLETDDVNPTPFIKDQNSLDEYISRLGNIYRSSNYNLGEDKMTYEPVTAGMAYLKSNGIREVKYYYRTFSEDGIISETLFNRFKAADDVLYHKVNGVITAVTENDVYDKTDKYLQKQPLMNGMGPHVDPIRSTDLDYKLHLPRNWKFNTESDLDFNNAGFDPRKQSYKPDAKNQVYLKKEKSGAVYPVHMTKEGYIAFGIDDETAMNSVQVPDAGYYVNNELQYVEQIDQRKFDFVLPEFGNVMSKLWDLVYPRGDWKQVTNPSYNDDDYKNGNYYYKDGDYYHKVAPGDDLDPDQTYWIFVPAPDDSTDANRYLFVGNDRAPNDYPKTIAGLIRYIYDLLGLETDNDFIDMPSKDTLWGLINGLIELLGKYTDRYDLYRFVPVRSKQVPFTDGTIKENAEYGELAGQIDWGSILTEKMYHQLNDTAFGPLYIIKDNDPQWNEVASTDKFNPLVAYYTKSGNTYVWANISGFVSGVTYYTAGILYEKARGYDKSLQYFRDMNSLWALLREFQEIRDKYQPDFINDNPASPAHINNRPSLIFGKFNIENQSNYDVINALDEWLQLSKAYKKLNITSQADLDKYLKDYDTYGSIYVKGMNTFGYTTYDAISEGAIYGASKEYYMVGQPIDTNLSNSSMYNRWQKIRAYGSAKPPSGGVYIGQQETEDGIIDVEIKLIELTPERLIALLEEVDNPHAAKDRLIESLKAGDQIAMDLDGNGMKYYRILMRDEHKVKVLSMDSVGKTSALGAMVAGTINSTNITYLSYEDGKLDQYLNQTWYNTLLPSVQEAIIPMTINQDLWLSSKDSSEYTYKCYTNYKNDSDLDKITGSMEPFSDYPSVVVGERKIYAPGIQDILDYFKNTNVLIKGTATEFRNVNILKMFWDVTTIPNNASNKIWCRSTWTTDATFGMTLSIKGGAFGSSAKATSIDTRAIFTIDLDNIDFSKKIITSQEELIWSLNKGDIIYLNVDGKGRRLYRILTLNDSIVKLLSLEDIITDQMYDSKISTVTVPETINDYTVTSVDYSKSDIRSYLNDTWYNNLLSQVQTAIQPVKLPTRIWSMIAPSETPRNFYQIEKQWQNIYQYLYFMNMEDSITDNVSLISLDDIENYFNRSFYSSENNTLSSNELNYLFTNQYDSIKNKEWLLRDVSDTSNQVLGVSGINGTVQEYNPNALMTIRPVFTIDLRNIDFQKVDKNIVIPSIVLNDPFEIRTNLEDYKDKNYAITNKNFIFWVQANPLFSNEYLSSTEITVYYDGKKITPERGSNYLGFSYQLYLENATALGGDSESHNVVIECNKDGKSASKTYDFTYELRDNGESIGTVNFAIDLTNLGFGVIDTLSDCEVTQGATALDTVTEALEYLGYTVSSDPQTGSLYGISRTGSGFRNANIPEELQTELTNDHVTINSNDSNASITNNTYTTYGQWTYAVNGRYYERRPLGGYYLSDGDTIVLRYTLYNGKDIGAHAGGQNYSKTYITDVSM